MDKTAFAGLTRLAPGESLGVDGYSFQNENPNIIDRYLEIGAVGHRHDGHAALADPTTLPVVVAVAGGGGILAGTAIFATYTLLDADGGETLPATPQAVTTDAPLDPPDSGPTIALDTSAGSLLTNTYLYALTFTDGNGGETTLGPASQIQRPPGPANAQVQVTGLTALLAASGAPGWRLWRSVGGGRFGFIAAGGTDTYTDDGAAAIDCTVSPPTRNTTNGVNQIEVTVDAPQPADAVQFRIYLSTDASFDSPSLAGTYAIDQVGVAQVFTVLDLGDGSPPDVSRSVPGASRLDAATDLDNLYWGGPVADAAALPGSGNVVGDVRLALDTMTPYAVSDTGTDPDTWVPIGGGGGGGGSGGAYFNAWGIDPDDVVIYGGDTVYWGFSQDRVMVGGTGVSVDYDVPGIDALVCGSVGLWEVEYDIAVTLVIPDATFTSGHTLQWVEVDHFLLVPTNIAGLPNSRSLTRRRLPVRVGKRVDEGSTTDDSFTVHLAWRFGHKFYVGAGSENKPVSYYTAFTDGNFTDGVIGDSVTSVTVEDKNWATLTKLG